MAKKEHYFCDCNEITEGTFIIKKINGKSIGATLFEGEYKLILNFCPHEGAEICKGRISNPIISDTVNKFIIDDNRKVLVCPWHKWEFDMKSGFPLVKGNGKVLFFKSVIKDNQLFILI